MSKKIKILLIGGAGYIGSRLCEDLCETYHITCLDFFKYSKPNLKSIDIVNTDYFNISKDYLSKFDAIILLAGHSSVRMCDGNSSGIMQNNVFNFIKLIDMIEDQVFIYASSGSVYGDCKYDIASEEIPYDLPYNMYDMSKQTIDSYAIATKAFDKKIYGLRFGTVNGYSKIFRNDVMLNAMSTSAINDKKVNVFSANTKRSILGINDLIKGIVSILECKRKTGGIYNMASFTKTSGEMGNHVANYFNVSLNLITENQLIQKNLNEKLTTSKYNFALNTDKFCKDFNFTFKENIDSILNEIKSKWETMIPTNRNEKFNYEINYGI